MSYENAPATKLVATRCLCCGRPLVDAASVERGVGPECAKKYGYVDAQGEPNWELVSKALGPDAESVPGLGQDARKVANFLVWRLAVHEQGPRAAAALDALGFRILAKTLAARLGAITVETEGDVLIVRVPYNELFNVASRKVPGSRWNADRKVRMVPVASKAALWVAIKSSFESGTLVVGSRVTAVP
jgi:Family of unknown function (DUF6011)